MQKRLVKRIASYFSYIVIIVLLCAIAFLIFCNISNKVAYIGDKSVVRIISSSMSPTIPTDTFIEVKKVSAKSVKIGDVIVFNSTDPSIYGKLNTHRVIKIENLSSGIVFTTKGDNSSIADIYKVDETQLAGMYVKNLKVLSTVSGFLRKPIAFLILILFPAVVLLFFAIKDFVKSIKKIKHEKLVEQEIEKLMSNGIVIEEDKNVSKNKTEE